MFPMWLPHTHTHAMLKPTLPPQPDAVHPCCCGTSVSVFFPGLVFAKWYLHAPLLNGFFLAQIGMGFKPRASSPLLTCWFFCWAHLAATLPKIRSATCLTPLPAPVGQEICLREIPRRVRRAESHQGALGARDRAAEGAPAPGHGGSAREGVAVQQQVTVSLGTLWGQVAETGCCRDVEAASFSCSTPF